MAYLDYEGAIAGDRGIVRRWDCGTYELVHESQPELKIRLYGRQIHGLLLLNRETSDPFCAWRATLEPT
jgi:hypothetical protein